jgi:uncharacterized membrane protein
MATMRTQNPALPLACSAGSATEYAAMSAEKEIALTSTNALDALARYCTAESLKAVLERWLRKVSSVGMNPTVDTHTCKPDVALPVPCVGQRLVEDPAK